MYEISILITSMVAAALTYEINVKRGHGAVKASAIVGLLFGLPAYSLSAMGLALGAFEAVPLAAIGASFAGMSSPGAIPSRKWMLITGAIFSGIFLFASPLFKGNGGGLGISACIAVTMTLGLIKTLSLAKTK